ncbi:hypothetical protein EQI52_06100 [Leuconostoc mesenteroides]|uniref:hypothetical protein n=1 Tax=Leuconostoc mesenteroides TaxID=1245 RepID=UPI000FFCD67B|nr:hypothetical protein [Leuconostoc mesenteroides]QAR69381.1 hypothetical protein EQI52_06100 [Leuconostoc mesenteroides]WJM73890.1 hypothetical protein QTN54_03750 [Leuconostoc mesenteroides]
MKEWEDEIQVKAQYIWENHKVALLVFILVFPLVIQIIFSVFNIIAEIESWNFKFPDSSNWIGFWGSYLGVIPSGLIAFGVARYQINQDRILTDERQTKDKLEFRKREVLTEAKSIFLEFKKMIPIYKELEYASTIQITDESDHTQVSNFLSYFTDNYFKILNDNMEKLKFEVDAFDILYKEELKSYDISVEIIPDILKDIIKLNNDLTALSYKKRFNDGEYIHATLNISQTGIGPVIIGEISDVDSHRIVLNIFDMQKQLLNCIEFLFNNIKNNIDSDLKESA